MIEHLMTHFEVVVPWVAAAAAAFALAAMMTLLMVPVVVSFARAARAMDYGGGRRAHEGAKPRLGGIAIAIGLAFGCGSVGLVMLGRWGQRLHSEDVLALIVGTAMVFLVGLAEDLVGVAPRWRFATELGAAGLVVAMGWEFHVLALPFVGDVQLGWLAPVVSLLWIVGVTNAINLIDGLDGLAAGVVGIIAASYLVFCALKGNLFSVVLMAAICGACLGFLRHNRAPAQLFMGDSGSLTLGFLLATISVHASLKAAGAVVILVPILALGVPVMDTLVVMLVRFLRRPGSPIKERLRDIFAADNNHLHHLLQGARRERTAVVRSIYVLVAAGCGAALFVAFTKHTVYGFALAAVELGTILLVRQMGWAEIVAERVRAREERKITRGRPSMTP